MMLWELIESLLSEKEEEESLMVFETEKLS